MPLQEPERTMEGLLRVAQNSNLTWLVYASGL